MGQHIGLLDTRTVDTAGRIYGSQVCRAVTFGVILGKAFKQRCTFFYLSLGSLEFASRGMHLSQIIEQRPEYAEKDGILAFGLAHHHIESRCAANESLLRLPFT